jgi:hypothetical protein
MYQLEVKAGLVDSRFRPSNGWNVTVDVDAMERCRGGTHPADKRTRAEAAEARLRALGVAIAAHSTYGRADLVATHPSLGTFVVEVEGESSRQREQAMYSALGQTLVSMHTVDPTVTFALVVPDTEAWERQLRKVPSRVLGALNLQLFLVSMSGARTLELLEADA